MARTYRDIAIENMLGTVQEAMSQAIDWWGDLPPPMKEAIEQFRIQLGAAIDSVDFVKRALDRQVPENDTGKALPPRNRRTSYVASTQPGMFSNCGRSSGFAQSRRRLVNISSTGSMPWGLSRLPTATNIIPGKLSRLVVKTLAPQLGQKFRSRPLPDCAM